MIEFDKSHWALILGGSSGFGLATAKKLARHGMNIAIVHRDRRGSMKTIQPEFDAIAESGVGFVSFNLDALSEEGRGKVLDGLAEKMGEGRVRMLMHSIAFGNLKLVAPQSPNAAKASAAARTRLAEQLGVSVDKLTDAICAVFPEADDSDALSTLAPPPEYNSNLLMGEEDYARTVHSMGTSLSSWTQDVYNRGLFASDARVLGMTSEGNEIAWRGYAAVAAAKVAMESVSRSIAVEFAPYGIRSNIVQAGVTPTRALALIPGSAQLKASARLRNPFSRLTSPEDVADVIALLCTDEAAWINGTIVRADGGEHIGG
jgi:NAD(P)-dependent dehydrogenase (short-subunit alcohol dehydrogenase family)